MLNIQKAALIVQQGGIIAYPTEAVFGLGCDPWNEQAVHRILTIKKRPIEKGLILITDSWKKLQALIQEDALDSTVLARIQANWPGPYTWVFPASQQVPAWIRGDHTSIALRITAHPIARAICEQLETPLVSTSANLLNHAPLRDTDSVSQTFGNQIDYIVAGNVGELNQATEIRDAITGHIIRGTL